ncbi:MAG TPA: hypothetical protein VME17_07035 [Bryobacteraceae bacterium]|nr:hypothetical protein [Bryobacteraceae bacterium]
MPESLGRLEAKRIRKTQTDEASQRAWLITKREIVRTDGPLFLEQSGKLLEQNAADFNEELGLTIERGIQVQRSSHVIDIRNNGKIIVVRRIVHIVDDSIVKIATQIVFAEGKTKLTEEALRFDVTPDGQVTLGGRNFVSFADRMFKDISAPVGSDC